MLAKIFALSLTSAAAMKSGHFKMVRRPMTDDAPRLMTREQAAAYCGVTYSCFGTWIWKGIIPPALPGTRRWDRRAIDQALDKQSGIKPVEDEKESEVDRWFREYEENKHSEGTKLTPTAVRVARGGKRRSPP